MSLDDLNREQKRMLKRQGAIDEKGAPTRAVRQSKRERVGPAQYLREVRDEMRKVAWPSQRETINLTAVVIALSAAVGLFLGGVDFVFQELFRWLLGLGSSGGI